MQITHNIISGFVNFKYTNINVGTHETDLTIMTDPEDRTHTKQLHETAAHKDAPQYQAGLQKG